MVNTSIINGKKYRRDENISYRELHDTIEKYLADAFNNDKLYKREKKYPTTQNATLINVYNSETDEIVAQIVKSYYTYVLFVTNNYVLYSGFISQTTTQHITRFFKSHNKFTQFDYSDVGKQYK